jgi:voltage-gated potassium channel
LDFYEPTAQQWEDDLKALRARLVGAGMFLVSVTIIGTVGFRIIDPAAGWVRSFFMTAITLTTVGYGHEVALESDIALIFTAMLILVGMGGALYFVSTATAFVVEGQLGHVFQRRRMERQFAEISDHLIVCGSGSTAVYAAAELQAVGRKVVFLIDNREAAEEAKVELPDIPIILGDPTDDDLLRTAGIERAAGLVACTDSDNENVVITLTARQINPKIRIVSRVDDIDHETKIRKVGADAVVSPNFIGGLRMASELIRPTVVDFLDTMLRDREMNLRIDEIRIPDSSPAVGVQLKDMGFEKTPDVLLLAVRQVNGEWTYNPLRSDVVAADTVLIFLGTPEDSRALCDHLGGEMISPPARGG